MNNQTRLNYTCPKCGNTDYEVDQIRTTGGGFSKIFDVQNKKFVAVSCTRCRYTELYKSETTALGNIFDFLTRG
ncbi:MAG: GTP-binding protein [Candidatus Neomarinimicrobiota bacterium]|nr:zinc ribbon domain-containing protein [Candidatus Neomarinimicrobiota bacterium]RKY50525.1 MAG: GTP-binding protein [Candidatus Neomarinimicrobiota bacterium]